LKIHIGEIPLIYGKVNALFGALAVINSTFIIRGKVQAPYPELTTPPTLKTASPSSGKLSLYIVHPKVNEVKPPHFSP